MQRTVRHLQTTGMGVTAILGAPGQGEVQCGLMDFGDAAQHPETWLCIFISKGCSGGGNGPRNQNKCLSQLQT